MLRSSLSRSQIFCTCFFYNNVLAVFLRDFVRICFRSISCGRPCVGNFVIVSKPFTPPFAVQPSLCTSLAIRYAS